MRCRERCTTGDELVIAVGAQVGVILRSAATKDLACRRSPRRISRVGRRARYPPRSYGNAAQQRQHCLRHARWTPGLGSLQRVQCRVSIARTRSARASRSASRTNGRAPPDAQPRWCWTRGHCTSNSVYGEREGRGVRRPAEAMLPQFGSIAIAPEDTADSSDRALHSSDRAPMPTGTAAR